VREREPWRGGEDADIGVGEEEERKEEGGGVVPLAMPDTLIQEVAESFFKIV
jgi:hypothetical protein